MTLFAASAINVRLTRHVADQAGERPWSVVEFDDGIPAGRWISLRYRTSLYDPLGRPLIRFRAEAGEKAYLMPAGLFGRGQWVGYVPLDTVEVAIAPARARGSVGFDLVSCAILTRLSVVALGLSRNVRATLLAIWLRLTGARPWAHEMMRTACGSMPLQRYHDWRAASVRPLDPAGLDAPREGWHRGPHIRFVIGFPEDDASAAARATLESISLQRYPHWSVAFVGLPSRSCRDGPAAALQADGRLIHVRSDGEAAALWADLRETDIVAPLHVGDILPPYAIAALAEFALAHAGATLIYADEESVDRRGRYVDPELKPDWSPVLHSGRPYVGRALYFRVSALSRRAGVTPRDLLRAGGLWTKLSANAGKVGHLRRVLLTKNAAAKSDRRLAAVAPYLPDSPDPYATVIIPSRDRAGLLAACLSGVAGTQPPSFEVLIADNGSREAATSSLYRSAMADPRIRVLAMPGPFNFSDLCNRAAAAARGRILVFLNNDTAAMQPDWLARLAGWAACPEVGAVGARLLYPSGRLQHGGLVVGLGGYAAHIESGAPSDHPGYLRRLEVPHEVSAVTGACLAVEKTKFDAVGGFDAASFPVELGDVDLCLRLCARGWQTIYAPEVTLTHRESATRSHANDHATRYAHEHRQFVSRWEALIADDPFFHPALSLTSVRTMLDR